MAEIHVEAKKKATPVWIWIVLVLIVVAVVAYLLLRNKTTENNTVNKPNTTSFIQARVNDKFLI